MSVAGLAPKAPREQTTTEVKPAGRARKAGGLSKRVLMIGLIGLAGAGGGAAYLYFSRPSLPPGFAAGNGRLEATEIYVATKYAGRIKDVLFNEGDTVEAGQVVARMDTSALEAQLRQALAEVTAAQENRKVALTQIAAKRADSDLAARQYARSKDLASRGAVSTLEADVDQARMLTSRAELAGAQAEAVRHLASIEAAQATAERLRTEIADAVLVAPRRARVETRLSEPGEVLGAGGRVLSLVDLSDVYMYVFLPESVTGKVAVGSEARIVLDAAPQYPIRTFVSYVSPVAQFTPKTVETAEERHNLTFRVKLQIDKERLRQFEPLVKVGLPGMGYVRFDTSQAWPQNLAVTGVVPANLWKPTTAETTR